MLVLKGSAHLRSSNQLTNKIAKIISFTISKYKQEITDLDPQKLQMFHILDIFHSCMKWLKYKIFNIKPSIQKQTIRNGKKIVGRKASRNKKHICRNIKFCGWVKLQFDATKKELVNWEIFSPKLSDIQQKVVKKWENMKEKRHWNIE